MRINPLAIPTFVLAAVAFWIGIYLEQRASSRSARLLVLTGGSIAAIPGLMYVTYYTHLFDSAAWFYNFRAIPYTELLACGIGLLGGVIFALMEPETLGEKFFVPAITFILLFIPFMKSVLEPLDLNRISDRCQKEYCLQSTESTCGPASAATLLRTFGRIASERELASEAFTYRGGTENWYLARALHRRGIETRVIIQENLEELPAPSIAGVLLPGGAGHFVAVKSVNAEVVTIVDPLKGQLLIPQSQLASRYHFTGFFLRVKPAQ